MTSWEKTRVWSLPTFCPHLSSLQYTVPVRCFQGVLSFWRIIEPEGGFGRCWKGGQSLRDWHPSTLPVPSEAPPIIPVPLGGALAALCTLLPFHTGSEPPGPRPLLPTVTSPVCLLLLPAFCISSSPR